jgi:type I restriction enzyme S subunit
MNRIVQVKDVVELNLATYKKVDFPTDVKYLDTSSLTKNKVERFQFLNIHTDVIPSRAQRKIKENTILYSTVRPNQEHYGIIEKLLDNIVVSTGFTTLDVIDNEINPKYLFYLLTQPHITEYLHTIATNSVSAYPSISPNDLGNLKFRVPELSTQQNIASVLSALDSKIELNNRINAELEAMAKTLYDYWFVQFDFPFDFAQGKPNEEGKPYKSSGGKMVWNAELKREVPEGWKNGYLNSIGDIIGGSTPSKAIDENFCQGTGMPWITPKDLSMNKGKKYITRGEWDVTEQGLKEASLKIMPKGTVLLSSRAPIGYLAIARTNVTTNQGFKSFVPKGNFSTEFIYYTVMNLIPEIEANSSGSTFQEVSTSTLRTIKTVIPTLEILSLYDKKIKPIFSQQDVLEEQNQKLAELRDWLLPMLMNGQVKVSEL